MFDREILFFVKRAFKVLIRDKKKFGFSCIVQIVSMNIPKFKGFSWKLQEHYKCN